MKSHALLTAFGADRVGIVDDLTSLILGHANPAVVKAVRERAKLGTARIP